ncbi:MAG TPA: FlgD immunoglobulin-like domain containing protein, partial [Spirochaetia bacterium]|nr:FlgD immunoglobulin-like domain containing protein [Spirochaetia bacterium]
GNASFGGVVGTTALNSLSVSGTTAVNTTAITTTTTQSYTGTVTLGANAVLTGSTPTFTAGVAGAAHDLTLSFTGVTVINGANFTNINNLTSNNGGTTQLTGTISTGGTQTYTDAVVLTGNTNVTSTGNAAISFNSTTNGGFGLTANSGGTTDIAGIVGGTTPLAGLTLVTGTLSTNANNITVSGPINTSGGAWDLGTGGIVALTGNLAVGTLSNVTGTTFVFNGSAAAQSVTPNGQTFYNFTVNSTYGTAPQVTLTGALTISSAATLTLTQGALSLNGHNLATGTVNIQAAGELRATAGETITVRGNWTTNATGTFTCANSTVIFDPNSAVSVTQTFDPGGQGVGKRFHNLTLANSAAAVDTIYYVNVTGNLEVTNTLTINGQINDAFTPTSPIDTPWYCELNMNANNLILNTLVNNGSLALSGTNAPTITVFDTNEGMVRYISAGGMIYALSGGNAIYYDVEISAANIVPPSAAATIQVRHRWIDNGSFSAQTSTVQMIDNSKAGVIAGTTTFYNLTITQPGKSVWFQAGTKQTVSGGTFTALGTGNLGSGNSVNLLSTYTDSMYPRVAAPPNTLPSPTGAVNVWERSHPTLPSPGNADPTSGAPANERWGINLGGASANIDYVYVEMAWADVAVVPTNLFAHTTDDWNYNWITQTYVLWSNTVDSNGDGKIDAIEAWVADTITLADSAASDFSGIDVTVDGYTVTGFDSGASYANFGGGASTNTFFIKLKPKSYLDTAATPRWRIVSNTSLKANTANAKVVLTAGDQTPVDTAPPVIGYTLAVAGKDQIFVHLSEPVYDTAGGSLTNANFPALVGASGQTVAGVTPVTQDGSGGYSELLLTLSAPLTASDLAKQATISITNARDNPTIPPAPPANLTVPGVHLWPNWPAQPPNPVRTVADPAQPAAIDRSVHRVTDVGLGPPGAGLVEPVYAWDQTVRDPARGGIGLITSFDGSAFLQPQDVTIQANVNPVVSTQIANPLIAFDASVGSGYLNNGLWMPDFSNAETKFSGLVPYPDPGVDSLGVAASPGGQLRNYLIPQSNAKIQNGQQLQFFFEDNATNPANPLFYGRITDSTSSTWYRNIRPWSIDIRHVISQRGDVTILNNVINPDRGQKTSLYYTLPKDSTVTIMVFDLGGDVITVLSRGPQKAGDHSTTWDGKNAQGRPVARGIYFIRLIASGMDEYRKVLIVR